MKVARILCVESYKSLQVARRMILERVGYDVQIAATFSEAISKASEQAFDVVVMCGSLGGSEAERLAQDLRTIRATMRVILPDCFLGLGPDGSDSAEILVASIRAALNDGQPLSEVHRKCA
jgi:CheY-like chemotaxis protein